jgi:hypothetical protein
MAHGVISNLLNWKNYFYRTPRDKDRVPLPPETILEEQAPDLSKKVSGLTIGTILHVYYADNPNNRSLLAERNRLTNVDHNSVVTTIKIEGTGEERQIVEPTVEYTFDSGYQLECDVRVTEGLQGEGSFLTHVPVSNLFGGFHNYAMCTPRGRSNTGINDSVEKSDGDAVLIQFIDGDIDRPMITGYAPHKYSNNCPNNIPKIMPPEDGLKFIINGTSLNINHDGDFLVNTTGAKSKQLLDISDGSIVETHPDRDILSPLGHPPGAIICQSNSNIILSASYKSKETNYGKLVLQSEQDTIIRSEKEDVEAWTDDPEKDVILQEPHGGIRASARQWDKVKITAGNENDLFKWCAQVCNVLNQVGDFLEKESISLSDSNKANAGFEVTVPIRTVLHTITGLTGVTAVTEEAVTVTADDPQEIEVPPQTFGVKLPSIIGDDLCYAGNLLKGLAKNYPLPMYAEGRIIEGSPYVTVGGTSTSKEINSEGEATSTGKFSQDEETLKEFKEECVASTEAGFVTAMINPAAFVTEYYDFVVTINKIIEFLTNFQLENVDSPFGDGTANYGTGIPDFAAKDIGNILCPAALYYASGATSLPPSIPVPLNILSAAMAFPPNPLATPTVMESALYMASSAAVSAFTTPTSTSFKDKLAAAVTAGDADDDTGDAYTEAVDECVDGKLGVDGELEV